MYKLQLSGRFKKSYKKCIKRGYDKTLFEEVVSILLRGEPLPAKYKNHPCMEIMKDGMIVIFFLIGFWYGSMIMMS